MENRIAKLGLLLLVVSMLASVFTPVAFAADTSRVLMQEDFENVTSGYGPHVKQYWGTLSVESKYLSIKNVFTNGNVTTWGAMAATGLDGQYGKVAKGGVPLAVFEMDVKNDMGSATGKYSWVCLQLKDSANNITKYIGVAVIGNNFVTVPSLGNHSSVKADGTGTNCEKIVERNGVGNEWIKIRAEVDTTNAKFRTTVLDQSGQQLGKRSEWRELNRDGTIYTLQNDQEISGYYAAIAHSLANSMYVDNIKAYESRPTVTANCNSEQGSVAISGSDVEGNAVRYGKSATVTVEPKQGFEIDTVSVQSGTAQAQDFGKQASFNLENVTEDTQVNVTFAAKPVQEPSITGAGQIATMKDFTYGDDPTPYNSAVIFSTIVIPDGWELTDDYGVQFTGGDVTDYKLVAFANAAGQFGIRIFGEGLETGKTYTVRAYAVLKNTATQETRTVTEAESRSFTIVE